MREQPRPGAAAGNVVGPAELRDDEFRANRSDHEGEPGVEWREALLASLNGTLGPGAGLVWTPSRPLDS
jgi:hypothetical protein